jgi:hypothetical protein
MVTFHTTMTLHNWVSSWIQDSLAFAAQRHVIKMWQKTLSLFWIPDILPEHCMHIVVIACSTEVYPFSPSKMCLVVPIHTLGTLHTFWGCNSPCAIPKCAYMSSKCIWTSSIFFEEKKIGRTADKEENGIVSNNSHVDIQCAQCHPCFSSKRHGIK